MTKSKRILKDTKKSSIVKYNPLSFAKSDSNNQNEFNSSLLSSQFRLLNEKFYINSSDKMLDYLKSNPNAFNLYHKGFQESKKKWKKSPFDWILPSLMKHFEDKCCKKISKRKKNIKKLFTVADLGCGEAELEKQFRELVKNKHGENKSKLEIESPQFEIKFNNIDFIAQNERVISADMKNTPIPTGTCDAVVFSLSLMGTNYFEFLKEAYRILKNGGVLLIVELESRIIDPAKFMIFLHDKMYFNKVSNDIKQGYFHFYHFQKKNFKDIPVELNDLKLGNELLIPSLYKKR